MIRDEIAELLTRYIGKFGRNPDRIYLGTEQIKTLGVEGDEAGKELMGMVVHRVEDKDHMYITGGN